MTSVTASAGPNARRGGTLTVLGCDGSYPGPGGATSGYLVQGDGVGLWLDAGPGTFANLQLVSEPSRVDAVVLSHEHPDHSSDLDSFALWLHLCGAPAPVPVYAPPGLRARCYHGDEPLFEWHEVEPAQRVTVRRRRGRGGDAGEGPESGLVCSFSATDHGPPTLAVRVDLLSRTRDPIRAAFGYSADTGPGWSPAELGSSVRTLLCEATYTRELEGSERHLSGRQAGTAASDAGIETLVVTHRRPSVGAGALLAEAAEAFGRPVHQAATGKVFEW